MKLAALLLFTTTTIAFADTPHEQADALYKRGREQLAGGKLSEACESFAKSDAAEPAATTLLALGVCREKLGQLATAAQIYREVGKRLQGATDATSVQLSQVAAANLAKVEPRLSHLTIAVSGAQPPGLEVRRGEGIVPIDSYGKPVALDGGTYAIAVRAPGREPWTTTITLGAEKDNQTVQVPVLPLASTTSTVGVAKPVDGSPPPPSATTSSPSRVVPIAVGVGALALGAVAIGLEVSASSIYDDAKVKPTDAERLDGWHKANTRRYIAEGVGVGAIAAAGVAVFLFVRGGHAEEPRVSLAPVITGDQVGFAIGGRY